MLFDLVWIVFEKSIQNFIKMILITLRTFDFLRFLVEWISDFYLDWFVF